MNSISIKAPADRVREFILNPVPVLRLNPSWHIRKSEAAGKGMYSLRLYDDKTDETVQINVQIEVREKTICYIMNSKMIQFFVDETGPEFSRLSIEGDMTRNADLPYWLRGLKGYILLEGKKGSVSKWFLDNVWLKLTPSQRRITVIIIMAEGIGLIALIAVVIALKLLKV
jgi:hypothetical protein